MALPCGIHYWCILTSPSDGDYHDSGKFFRAYSYPPRKTVHTCVHTTEVGKYSSTPTPLFVP